MGYLYRVQEFRAYLNELSEVPLGQWWVWGLRYVTPVVLSIILYFNIKQEINASYSDYPRWATLVGGWGSVLLWLVLGYILYKLPAKLNEEEGE